MTPLPLSRGLCAGVWWRRVANVANVANSFGVALTGANMGHELATCAPSPRVVPVANVANYPPPPWQGRRAGGRGDRPGLFGVPSGAAEVLATARVLRRGYSPSRPRCSSRWPRCSSRRLRRGGRAARRALMRGCAAWWGPSAPVVPGSAVRGLCAALSGAGCSTAARCSGAGPRCSTGGGQQGGAALVTVARRGRPGESNAT